MAQKSPIDIDYFGPNDLLSRIRARVSLGARRRMFDLLARAAGSLASRTVLDVGTTPDQTREDSNCYIGWLNEAGAQVTLYSPEEIHHLTAQFPGTTILDGESDSRKIPAADRSFDWIICSAVIEHVGGASDQEALLRECARVGKAVFLTTPNRGHWMEFHTKLPFLHWLPRPAHRAVLNRIGLSDWAEERNLRLIGRHELAEMAQRVLGGDFKFSIQTIWTLGMPSNLVLIAQRNNAVA